MRVWGSRVHSAARLLVVLTTRRAVGACQYTMPASSEAPRGGASVSVDVLPTNGIRTTWPPSGSAIYSASSTRADAPRSCPARGGAVRSQRSEPAVETVTSHVTPDSGVVVKTIATVVVLLSLTSAVGTSSSPGRIRSSIGSASCSKERPSASKRCSVGARPEVTPSSPLALLGSRASCARHGGASRRIVTERLSVSTRTSSAGSGDWHSMVPNVPLRVETHRPPSTMTLSTR